MSTLNERIESALERIKDGHGCMRIPADLTDPDLVLVACQERIAELEAQAEVQWEDKQRLLTNAENEYLRLEAELKAELQQTRQQLVFAEHTADESVELVKEFEASLKLATEAVRALIPSSRSPIANCWCPGYIDVTKGHTAACLKVNSALYELKRRGGE